MGLFHFFNGSEEWQYHRLPLYMSKKDEEEGDEMDKMVVGLDQLCRSV